MHVVTGFSFKGGVGRTMSLVNIGFELARRGKRVLFVDFDLEAPGITSYEPLTPASQREGIVDYVHSFLDTNIAPRVESYIYECLYKDEETGADRSVLVMSSGKQSRDYANKLASIDWLDLYESRSGYLLMEDLKQQWREIKPKIDYVLIDSRTGFTDVGGICTRQLPDAILFFFFPNIQNIAGLEVVCREVYHENLRTGKNIQFLFVPSNVPHLDDEFSILSKLLAEAKDRLEYQTHSAIIHRYDSLALLDQKVFVEYRPKTRLANEYRALTDAVVSSNLEDKEGALKWIAQFQLEVNKAKSDGSIGNPASGAADAIGKVRALHPRDPDIAWRLSSVYQSLGDIASEVDALNVVIEAKYRVADALYRRAFARFAGQNEKDAVADLQSILNCSLAPVQTVVGALEVLRVSNSSEWVQLAEQSAAVAGLKGADTLPVCRVLASNIDGLALASRLAQRALSDARTARERESAKIELVLCLIGRGLFAQAMNQIAVSLEEVMASKSITRVFNYAMAHLGLTKQPHIPLFGRVKELVSVDKREIIDANYPQCLAVTAAFLSDRTAAYDFLEMSRDVQNRGNVFSCWRYLRADRREMSSDLDEIKQMIEGRAILPSFVNRWHLQH